MSIAIKKSIRVLKNLMLEEGVYDLWLEADMVADAWSVRFLVLQ